MGSSTRRSTVLLTTVLALGVLAGCGDDNGGKGNGNGAGAPTSTGPVSSAPDPVPSETTALPTPDTAQTGALLAALTKIDPALAVVDTEAVQNSVALCGALREGDDPATAVPATFPDVDLSADQQQAVADAVTTGFCPLTEASSSPDASGTAVAT